MTFQLFDFSHDHGVTDFEDLKLMLGGKGAGLNRMTTTLEMPVPPGFTITTDASAAHQDADKLDPALALMVSEAVANLAGKMARGFGDPKNPLLVSVRSGAPVSMPGMMETILNLGLNDKTVEGLAKLTNEQFAWDSYRRFKQMYAVTVLGMEAKPFNDRHEAAKAFSGGLALPAEVLQKLCGLYDTLCPDVPQDVHQQLEGAILAVFKSWNAEKAVSYREIENIPAHYGTAVNVQTMVFGNLNEKSGTGVAFTRNPNTGENVRFGDFLINAQGEDVVDGSHVTLSLADMYNGNLLEEGFNTQADELEAIMKRLEAEYLDMCDLEFTIEDGKLWMLQTRTGKRAPKAAIVMAQDMYTEGLITEDTMKERVEAAEAKVTDVVAPDDNGIVWKPFTTGVAASPGETYGKAIFEWNRALKASADGPVILVRPMTSPDDVKGMSAAMGILTETGGLVSHAAVVARGWGKPCVVGASEMHVNEGDTRAACNGIILKEGQWVKINGETGEVWVEEGAPEVEKPKAEKKAKKSTVSVTTEPKQVGYSAVMKEHIKAAIMQSGGGKISAIKHLRLHTGLGLKEAKDAITAFWNIWTDQFEEKED